MLVGEEKRSFGHFEEDPVQNLFSDYSINPPGRDIYNKNNNKRMNKQKPVNSKGGSFGFALMKISHPKKDRIDLGLCKVGHNCSE